MAIKKLILPSTGIYQQRITSSSIRDLSDFEGFRDVVRMLEQKQTEENKPLPSLSELESKARQVVLQFVSEERGEVIDESSWNAVDYFARNILNREREDIYEKLQSASSHEQMRQWTRSLIKIERANDACNMLHHLAVIRGQLEHGSAEVAVCRLYG